MDSGPAGGVARALLIPKSKRSLKSGRNRHIYFPVRVKSGNSWFFDLLHYKSTTKTWFSHSQKCMEYESLTDPFPLQYSWLENPMDRGAWWAAVHGIAKSWTRLSDFTFTFHFHALEKEMATHSSVLAWRIPGTAEHGGLPSMGSHRVGHDWSDLAAATDPLKNSTMRWFLYPSHFLVCFNVSGFSLNNYKYLLG